MIPFLQSNLLWTEGLQIVTVLAALALGALLLYRPLFWGVVGLFIFSFYFFRNPDRVCVQALTDPAIIVCPADGKIVDIQRDGNTLEGYAYKISIFLSPFDVHVNWSPVAGVVEAVTYRPGTFSLAFLPKSSELNERNDVRIVMPDGRTVLVRQIAGTIARRICCWVKEGDELKAGQKIGMIRFGSRVDLFLPVNVELMVGRGQRVYGGHTVIGVLRQAQDERE
ncbi:MAG TPA: phosphatidylserine decarboxylase family protein [Candidatus Limnocylindria bacterium]|nr:phosphatidylserine decarboxylase family protein [Candidatus Limnocylindria bacterium]